MIFTAPHPIRVLHIIHQLQLGGAETLIMNIYRQINRQQVQFDFAVRSPKPDFYEKEVEELGGRVFHLPWQSSNLSSVVEFTRQLAVVLQTQGPFAAVHSHSGFYSGHYLPVVTKAQVPLRIAHSHTTSSEMGNTIVHRFWQQVMRHNIRYHANHWRACSLAAGKWLFGSDVQNKSCFKVMPNAIDLNSYAALPNDKITLRKQLKLPEQEILIGHVGRFDKVKNHIFLVDVFQQFLNKQPTAHLIFVGEGKLQEQIQADVYQKGLQKQVHFLGPRRDIPQILGTLDFFVLPSIYEGLGLVLIEAQAAGVPCLASNVIPLEANLNLGLLEMANLQDGADVWANIIQQKVTQARPAWFQRQTMLQQAGYDVRVVAQDLQDLYLSI